MTTGYFYYQDSLGNTSHVTDAAGNLLERYTYSAFGTPTFYNAAGAIIYNAAGISQSAFGFRHLFQGQLWTQETGLNDYRNRVELPTMGVFLQPDPIGFKGDAANIYRFCNNNAVNRSDPMGLLNMWGNLTDFFTGNPSMNLVQDAWNQQRSSGVTMAQITNTSTSASGQNSNASKPMRFIPTHLAKDGKTVLPSSQDHSGGVYEYQFSTSKGHRLSGVGVTVLEKLTTVRGEDVGQYQTQRLLCKTTVFSRIKWARIDGLAKRTRVVYQWPIRRSKLTAVGNVSLFLLFWDTTCVLSTVRSFLTSGLSVHE